eukprot:365913-Chlamydomonas_euryale.AAC.2
MQPTPPPGADCAHANDDNAASGAARAAARGGIAAVRATVAAAHLPLLALCTSTSDQVAPSAPARGGAVGAFATLFGAPERGQVTPSGMSTSRARTLMGRCAAQWVAVAQALQLAQVAMLRAAEVVLLLMSLVVTCWKRTKCWGDSCGSCCGGGRGGRSPACTAAAPGYSAA